MALLDMGEFQQASALATAAEALDQGEAKGSASKSPQLPSGISGLLFRLPVSQNRKKESAPAVDAAVAGKMRLYQVGCIRIHGGCT